MKKAIILFIAVVVGTLTVSAQRNTTITGTAVIYGSGYSTRTITRPFTLIINNRSSSSDMTGFVEVLQSGGQDSLRRELDRRDVGRFSLGSGVGVPVGSITVDRNGDGTRIRAIFTRNVGFGELRNGLRSADYPFGYVEIILNQNGKGDGTIIPAAKIRFRGADTIEVEDFGTFPGRLMGVQVRSGSVR
ncbi:MAG TPA: hypothetical protein VJV05_07480 [Pyrinomonadaceae bacterium]|nr:hypothetical protein [Pyrinomonadaceae bacterium]